MRAAPRHQRAVDDAARAHPLRARRRLAARAPHARRHTRARAQGRRQGSRADRLRRPPRARCGCFGKGLGDQAGWILPFALFGLLGLALTAGVERKRASAAATRAWRLLLVLGGWLVVEAAVLSLSKGIVHPYYVSALAPGTGAMAGAGALAFAELARGPRRLWGLALVALALAATLAAQIVLMHREHYMAVVRPRAVRGRRHRLPRAARHAPPGRAGRRVRVPAGARRPTGYATTTWLAPVEGTFPVAGPKAFAGTGGYGVNDRDLGDRPRAAATTSAPTVPARAGRS